MTETRRACRVKVRGVVQGVGFRPFVYRLAHTHSVAGWVRNEGEGVEIHLEGDGAALDHFVHDLSAHAPPAATVTEVHVATAEAGGMREFHIRSSELRERPTTRVSPDLPVCERCLLELFDAADPRHCYPYINCTDCGPRFSILTALPYDRANTTMAHWQMDAHCSSQYSDPQDRRFHAQPVACPGCGPHFRLGSIEDDAAAIAAAAGLLRQGGIIGVKGLGGYHLACDARDPAAVRRLRDRKYRKEKPFALMVRDVETARAIVHLTVEAEELLGSVARPIVLVEARATLDGVAPDNRELGVMLPYTPLHHLLFAAGAPAVLAMTSGNRSSEPIAYTDSDAADRLAGIADALLIGERPIARRVDDSVARAGAWGPVILRRSRGYAPGSVARLRTRRPILAVGADLKNTIALAVEGEVFVSQHIGDLEHFTAFEAFRETSADLLAMYSLDPAEVVIAHDLHPQYASTRFAIETAARRHVAVQHHEAHIASVVAEREGWNARVVGVAWDGTGFGRDGTIQGSEFFVGSVAEGFERVAHLRGTCLPGGDAAARFPVQAAAGYLSQLDALPALTRAPFFFPGRYAHAARLAATRTRSFHTTSAGRLFDTAAAIAGFTREITYEGQAAMWLEQLARQYNSVDPYPFPFEQDELDFRPLLQAMVRDRAAGRDPALLARSFHIAVADGVARTSIDLLHRHRCDAIVLSGGVFQNELLMELLKDRLADCEVWTNHEVPPNDGGISLGQAALAAFEVERHA